MVGRRANDVNASSADTAPTVSIGLAVYNGERHLAAAIDSILAQTFTDFELVICDNASTDGTEALCRGYERADERVRYHRNDRNIGGARNENLTFERSRAQYFRWAAHDDVLAPTLLERCVEVLDAHPDVVLCHTDVVTIDEDGNEFGLIARRRDPTLGPVERFRELTDVAVGCEETYGLMRSDALAATGLQRNYTDSDRTLLAHLALLGRFHEIPEPLFYKRVHAGNSMHTFPDWRDRMQWFGDDVAGRITLPHWSQLWHYLAVITTAPVSIGSKLRLYGFMFVWVGRYRRWRSLGKDLVIAAYRLVARTRARLGRGAT